MIFRTSPAVGGMESVEISFDNGESWRLVAMAVNAKAARTIKSSFQIVMEIHAEAALNELLELIEDEEVNEG